MTCRGIGYQAGEDSSPSHLLLFSSFPAIGMGQDELGFTLQRGQELWTIGMRRPDVFLGAKEHILEEV